ncbi:MAG TPA: hypothetical protein VG370_26325 [Chloroflexota bacterium]|nr:hypothetical protein [Chloroflexota bacterium]
MKTLAAALGLSLLLAALASLTACGGQAPSQSQSASIQVGARSAPPQRSTAYTIAARDRVDEGDRKRLRAKLVLTEGLDTDKSIEAIRGAVQELLPADGEVNVVEVLVYRSAAETGGDWTFGHGFASKDGKGWSGNGAFGQGVFDRSNIELDLKLPNGEEHFSLAR